MTKALQQLLKMDARKLPEEELKIISLSKLCGEDVIFKIRGLTPQEMGEISEDNETSFEQDVEIVLAGVVDPDLHSNELRQRFTAEMERKYAETFTVQSSVCKLLSAGEIALLSRRIQKLSGYQVNLVEDIKKK